MDLAPCIGSAASSSALAPPAPKPQQGQTQQALKAQPHNRRIARRDSDEKVDRAVAAHTGHLDPLVVENRMVGGKTIRQRVAEKMASIQGSAGRLGTKWWDDTLALYSASTSPLDALPMDVSFPPRACPIQAMQYLKHGNPTKRTCDPLVS